MALREVIVENGRLRGVASGIPSITVYKGVPYASAPIGPLRWKEPQPCQDWEGVYDAGRFRAMAPQTKSTGYLSAREFCGFGQHEECSEDCLYLNIWTPAQSSEERLPVLFYIHGGAFCEGYSYDVTIDGDSFGLQGCILVTVEYRMGILGFLSHPLLTLESEHHASGNYGLLDQAFALQWVHRNIAAFGGDPDNITILGQSAGAVSVNTQICTSLTKGIIAKAIMQSGGGYTGKKIDGVRRKTLAEAEEIGKYLFSELGVSSLEEARALSMETIIEVQRKINIYYWPIIDGYFLTEDPDDTIKRKGHHDIPIMIGQCADESGWFRKETTGAEVDAEAFEREARQSYGEYAEAYLEACGYYEDPVAAAGNRMHDCLGMPALAYCELSTHWKNRKPPYYYYFERELPGDNFGAFHAGDLWYVFNTLHRSWRPFNGNDYMLAKAINTYICNFAKCGNPNGDNLPVWKPYTATNRAALALGERISMLSYPGMAGSKVLVDLILER